MADTGMSALHRKLKPRSAAAGSTLEAIEGILEITIPREADSLVGLTVSLIRTEVRSLSRAALLDGLEEGDLIYRLSSPKGEVGICWIDAALLSALIEVQTTGRLSPNTPERRPTWIDSVIAEDLIDSWIFAATAQAAESEEPDALPFSGYDRQPNLLSRRGADLVLELCDFAVVEATLDLGGGVKRGSFALAVPETSRKAVRTEAGGTLWDKIKKTKTPMRALLPPIQKPADYISTLAEGDVLPVPIESLADVSLEVRSGETVARARLGHAHGKRALRLKRAIDEAQLKVIASAGFTTPAVTSSKPRLLAQPEPENPADDGLPELPEIPDLPVPDADEASGA